MAGPFYVSYGDGDDANDGLSTSTPKKTLQAGRNLMTAAGEILYCKLGGAAKETGVSGGYVDYAGLSGTLASKCKVIGVNESWVNDGTFYKIDASQYLNNVDFWELHNIWVDSDPTYTGFWTDGSGTENVYYNCKATDCNVDGFRTKAGDLIINCLASGNVIGFNIGGIGGTAINCMAKDNSGDGFQLGNTNYLYNIISHNNAVGVDINGAYSQVIGCVIDGNSGNGVDIATGLTIITVSGMRGTNNGAYALVQTGTTQVIIYDMFFDNNTSGDTSGTFFFQGQNVETSGAQGYNDRANDDFTLTDSATLRRTMTSINVLEDTTNQYGAVAGMVPDDSAGGGGYVPIPIIHGV